LDRSKTERPFALKTASPHLAANPSPGLLCEACGYPLPDPTDPTDSPHSAHADCPECGRPVVDSLPERRPGVAWQHRFSAGAWARTAAGLARSPGGFFDILSTRGSPAPDRLYLLVNACAAGVITGALAATLHRQPPLTAWLLGMAAAKGVLLFSYVEAAGLWFFSRRHGWRVPFARAQRIVAYASVGWLPAAALIAAAAPALAGPGADALGRRLLGAPHPLLGPLLILALLGAAGLAFETLAWVGVRRLRYAN